jgi:hypothetical protein
MRRPISMVFAVAVTIGAVLPAAGQESARQVWLQPGMQEFSLWGSLNSYGDNTSSLRLAGDFGFMLSSRHEVGPTFNLQLWDSDLGTDAWGSFGVFYRYSIPIRSRHLIPFGGARVVWPVGVVWLSGYDQEWDAEARAEVGIRYIVAGRTSLDLTTFYRRTFGSLCEWSGCSEDEDRIGFAIGISVFFSGGPRPGSPTS